MEKKNAAPIKRILELVHLCNLGSQPTKQKKQQPKELDRLRRECVDYEESERKRAEQCKDIHSEGANGSSIDHDVVMLDESPDATPVQASENLVEQNSIQEEPTDKDSVEDLFGVVRINLERELQCQEANQRKTEAVKKCQEVDDSFRLMDEGQPPIDTQHEAASLDQDFVDVELDNGRLEAHVDKSSTNSATTS